MTGFNVCAGGLGLLKGARKASDGPSSPGTEVTRKAGAEKTSAPLAPADAPQTHVAGEMFVAAELAKRGYLVSLTMGNAKAVDLFVERHGRALCVQVKAIARKRYAGWPLPMDKSKIKLENSLLQGKVMWVCVILNDVGQQPTYFVLQPDQVLHLGKWYRTRAILNVKEVLDYQGRWDLIEAELGRTTRAQATPPRSAAKTATRRALNGA